MTATLTFCNLCSSILEAEHNLKRPLLLSLRRSVTSLTLLLGTHLLVDLSCFLFSSRSLKIIQKLHISMTEQECHKTCALVVYVPNSLYLCMFMFVCHTKMHNLYWHSPVSHLCFYVWHVFMSQISYVRHRDMRTLCLKFILI